MKGCCFIIPYFGKFPNYFPLFLKSCSYNKDFNWLIITNNNTLYDYPDNVKVINMNFSELQNMFQSKFKFKIKLNSPYKLCDYKPAYGYIFENHIKDFKYWGHCDIDTIMGNLSQFLIPLFKNKYDKIFCLGHMTIYKNSYDNNRIFMSEYKGEELYKKVFSSNNICWFDEEWKDEFNINRIFLNQNKNVFEKDLSLNFSIFKSNFLKVTYDRNSINADKHGYVTETYKDCIYLWEQGHIKRYYIDNNNLRYEEYPYIHLQKRNMLYFPSVIKQLRIRIVPNYLLKFTKRLVTISDFHKINKRYINLQYWYIYIYPKIKRQIKRLI